MRIPWLVIGTLGGAVIAIIALPSYVRLGPRSALETGLTPVVIGLFVGLVTDFVRNGPLSKDFDEYYPEDANQPPDQMKPPGNSSD